MPELLDTKEEIIERVEFPIKKIFKDIAKAQGISLNYFNQEYFLPEKQKENFPYLKDLSIHKAFPFGLGIEIKKRDMVAFEGSVDDLALAYFGEKVKKYSRITKEEALVNFEGRRIHIVLNENGNGAIEISDPKIEKAIWGLGEDSFGSNYDKCSKAEYGFRQEFGSKLNGVRKFLEKIIE